MHNSYSSFITIEKGQRTRTPWSCFQESWSGWERLLWSSVYGHSSSFGMWKKLSKLS